MIYRIRHRTVYDYTEPVTISHHAARLRPRTTAAQEERGWSLKVTPTPAVDSGRRDFFGNAVSFFTVQQLHSRLDIVSESEVVLQPGAVPDLDRSPPWEFVVESLRRPVAAEEFEAQQFTFESPHVRPSRELAAYAAPSFVPGRPVLAAMNDLNRRIFKEFTFDPAATTVATPLEEVLKARRGVCQDFTHLALGCVRSLGLAARYVSGYLRTYREKNEVGLVGADASHAWLSVFSPEVGWVDFDPTNNLLPRLEHITVAYGRDFAEVSPVSGIIVGGGEHRVNVAVRVEVLDPAAVP